eukprot:TRINITY_DN17368_c0_g1_i1.p2 TRINITY_DN17368_c0_g1~~TRINITY_DN17368_c0_g1_i1.p2  ORF type:complete len:445 (-),score=35.36 TRINITY_DN17368_c0_g1_i1:268-1602(-)
MVGARAGAVDELEAPAHAMGRAQDQLLKVLEADQAGAGAGHQEAPRSDQADGQAVEVLVFAPAVGLFLAAEDQLGRIGNHDVPALAVLAHLVGVGEGVGVDPVDARLLVEVAIAAGLGHRGFIQVHPGDIRRPGHRGRDGKPAGVAAEVQHAPVLGHAGQLAAVVALVAEKAGLVALGKVDLEPHAVLTDAHAGRGPEQNPPPPRVRIRENGVRFEVDFSEGHKTGFFCDQRDNRRQLARMSKDRRVLDLCCYTGGFAVSAAVAGASDVTGVDLDETAVAQARRNGNLNQQPRIHWVHADAFTYAHQMRQNGESWDVVIADPPKLILSREEEADGWRKYEDLNSLAIGLVAPGGLLVTCSCSGLVSLQDFEQLVLRSAHRMSRRLQLIDGSGAGPDHPVLSTCLDGRYLKVIWARVIQFACHISRSISPAAPLFGTLSLAWLTA